MTARRCATKSWLSGLPACVFGAVVVLACALASFGQAKPPPPPPPAPPPLPTPDYAAFRAAYDRAGRPVTLTLVGYSLIERETKTVESALWDLDPTGFTFQLRSAFNEFLNTPEIDMELVSPAELTAAVDRLKGNLDIRREREAIDLLSREAKADLTITINLTKVTREDARPARGQMTVTNARGRELMNFPFQWNVGTDLPSVRLVAEQLVVALVNDYVRRGGASQRWTLRLLDFNEPEAVLGLRAALEGHEDIEKVVPRRGSSGRGDATRELEVTTTLDALELEVLVGRGLEAFKLKAETVSTEGQTVNIRVVRPRVAGSETKPPSIVECVEAIADASSEQGKGYRARLLNAYNAQRQPNIAVLVNRRPTTPSELKKAEPVAGSGGGVNAQTVILVSGQNGASTIGTPGGGAGPDGRPRPEPGSTMDEEFREISQMNNLNVELEGHLFEMLGTELLGFNKRVAADKARAAIAAAASAQRDVYSEAELATLLRSTKVADLFLEGVGTMEITHDAQKMPKSYKARYTFWITTLDGRRVAEAPGLTAEAPFEEGKQDALRDMARQAIAKMACQLLDEWLRDPQVPVTINGVTANADYLAIAKVIGERKVFSLAGDVIDSRYGPSNGFVKFLITVKAGTPQTQIEQEFIEMSKLLPFELVSEGGTVSNGLIFTLKPKG